MGKCILCEDSKSQSGNKFCPECLELIEKCDLQTLNEEKNLNENVFIGRFNNFLVVFSLIVTAGFASNFQTWRWFIFYF